MSYTTAYGTVAFRFVDRAGWIVEMQSVRDAADLTKWAFNLTRWDVNRHQVGSTLNAVAAFTDPGLHPSFTVVCLPNNWYQLTITKFDGTVVVMVSKDGGKTWA